MSKRSLKNLGKGFLFISPWLLGFLFFNIYPIIYSFYMSFTEYSGFGQMVFVGIQNYGSVIQDDLFWKSAYNTLYYTFFAVPLGVVVAIILALAMNQKLPEVTVYRAVLYLPSILPVFALSFVWIVFLNPRFGLFNHFLKLIGLPAIDMLGDPLWTKPSIVLMAQLGAGGPALIFLAALRSIPKELYESAQIDGAGPVRRFFSISLPLITSVILYDLILGLAQGLQIFTQAYIITSGAIGGQGTAGPLNSLLFYVFYLYKIAFQYMQMGYAAALAWILFIVSILLSIVIFKWSRKWVYYDGNE